MNFSSHQTMLVCPHYGVFHQALAHCRVRHLLNHGAPGGGHCVAGGASSTGSCREAVRRWLLASFLHTPGNTAEC